MKSTDQSLLHRVTLVLLFSILFVIALYAAKGILIPVTVAALLAMLLLPMVRKLEAWKLGKFFSILISVFSIVVVMFFLIGVLSAQVLSFSSDVPLIQEKINQRFTESQQWVETVTGITGEKQLEYLQHGSIDVLGMAQSFVSNILIATSSTFVLFGLVLILIFFFLSYRERIKNFMLHLIPKEEHINTKKIIAEVSKVTQKYLTGVFSVMLILSVLNSVVFLIIGVPHAIFFGVLAAILNVIPYIGVWIGTSLPMIMMAITQDSITPIIAIVAGIWVNQQIDNNFLTPKITGSKVSINPLATILVLIAGSMIWGVAGMVLFIPLLGVAKIICDNVEGLKPLGYLIGEDKPEKPGRIARFFQNAGKKKKA